MSDRDLDLVLRALSHPLRRRILRALVVEARSASDLSNEFGMALGVVSYHLNTVLDRECEVVDLADSVQRRGALKKFYCLKGDLRPYTPPSAATKKGKEAELSIERCVLAVALGVVDPSDVCLPGSPPKRSVK